MDQAVEKIGDFFIFSKGVSGVNEEAGPIIVV
jgi:hypothetical protein